jgi:hypothetical protein
MAWSLSSAAEPEQTNGLRCFGCWNVLARLAYETTSIFPDRLRSIYRICRTTLEGWRRYKNDPDLRLRARFTWEARSLRDGYAAALWAMEKHLGGANRAVADQVRGLRQQIGREFGLVSRVVTRVLGPVLLWSTRREERRLAAGQTYEPPTIVERRNWAAAE